MYVYMIILFQRVVVVLEFIIFSAKMLILENPGPPGAPFFKNILSEPLCPMCGGKWTTLFFKKKGAPRGPQKIFSYLVGKPG